MIGVKKPVKTPQEKIKTESAKDTCQASLEGQTKKRDQHRYDVLLMEASVENTVEE